MLRSVLERNRKLREYNNIQGKCVRYSFISKLVAHNITIDTYGITMEMRDEKLIGNMYVWYEVYYGASYVLIKDLSSNESFYLYPRKICIEYLSMIIHDLISTGSNISLLLDIDDNQTIRRLIMDIIPKFGRLLMPNDLYSFIRVSYMPMDKCDTLTYDVPSPVLVYKFNIMDGYYNLDKVLTIPSISRIYKIIAKYIVDV